MIHPCLLLPLLVQVNWRLRPLKMALVEPCVRLWDALDILVRADECLIIFDCDGVLVDSESIASQVFSSALQEVGLLMSPEETDRRFRGRSLPDCLTLVEQLLGRPLPEGFLVDLKELTRRAFERQLAPVEGVESVLAWLSQRGFACCVASSGSPEKIRFSLLRTGLFRYFRGEQRLFSAEAVEHGKPAPDLFLFAARQCGFAPQDCVVIEDSMAGMQGALAASMQVIAYLGGQQSGAGQQADEARRAISALPVTAFTSMDAVLLHLQSTLV